MKTQLPIGLLVTSPTVSDTTLVTPLLDPLRERFSWFRPEIIEADKGFDSAQIIMDMLDRGTGSIVPLRELGAGHLRHGVFTSDGVPTCKGKVSMVYVRTDGETGCYVYRLADGCDPSGKCLRHKVRKSAPGYSVRGEEVWIDPLASPWLFGYPWRRGSEEWKLLYNHRGAIERLFSFWKDQCRLNDHRHRGLAKIRLHAILQALVWQAKIVRDLRLSLAEDSASASLLLAAA